jgi:hypothetical protein
MNEKTNLFTCRGRPVLFKHEDGSFSESLHATERGYFPISLSGYRSLAGCFFRYSGVEERKLEDIVNAESLELLAVEEDKERKDALVRAKRALKYNGKCGVSRYINIHGSAPCLLSWFFCTRQRPP